MAVERKDPYQGFRFRVEIEGLIVGGFSEISGLQIETQVEEVKEGGVNDYIHRLPKETKYPNLVLKRGLTDSDALWQWHQDVTRGKISRKTVHVILLSREYEDVWRLSFEHAYPVKWVGMELKADSNSVAVETIELAHNGFKRF
jgi:phage tail-like protein